MGDTRRNQYFIPGEGIAREVITADICKYLDNDALVRPGNYQGIDGYYIFAYRNLTREMIEDLKADSSRWDSEKRNRHRPNNRGPTDYVNSRTHASRAETGPSYADDPYANGGGGMGGSGGLPPRGSLPPTGVAINSRQNASPYSNDGAYTYQPPPSPLDHPPTPGAPAGGFGSNGYPPAQPRSSTGLPSTSAYPSNPHIGASSGGPPFAGASSGAPSFGVSAPTSYGGSTTQSYPPPPSTAPTHGSRGAFADSSAPRPPRTDMRSGGGYDYGDSRADSRPYTDQSRSGFGSADSGRRRY